MKYALIVQNRAKNNCTFFTGQFTDCGKPQSSTRVENARHYKSARKAYMDATRNKGLAYYRAVPLTCRQQKDGFQSGWWIK